MGLLALLLGGCAAAAPTSASPDPCGALETNGDAIDAVVRDLLDVLDTADMPGATAVGRVEPCQSEPAPGVAYRAAITVPTGADPAAAFDALLARLEEAGWQSTGAYAEMDVDTKPMGRYARDGVVVDVKTGGFAIGETQYGTDEMVIGVTLEDGCVRVPDGGSISGMQDLAGPIPPRS